MTITVQETLRGAFYAPFYVALARGACAEEGVDVRLRGAAAPGRAALDLMEGIADVSWTGRCASRTPIRTCPAVTC